MIVIGYTIYSWFAIESYSNSYRIIDSIAMKNPYGITQNETEHSRLISKTYHLDYSQYLV